MITASLNHSLHNAIHSYISLQCLILGMGKRMSTVSLYFNLRSQLKHSFVLKISRDRFLVFQKTMTRRDEEEEEEIPITCSLSSLLVEKTVYLMDNCYRCPRTPATQKSLAEEFEISKQEAQIFLKGLETISTRKRDR